MEIKQDTADGHGVTFEIGNNDEYLYDDNGNLTLKDTTGDDTEYYWDAANMLTKVKIGGYTEGEFHYGSHKELYYEVNSAGAIKAYFLERGADRVEVFPPNEFLSFP
jgi:YD repeat-containing protein